MGDSTARKSRAKSRKPAFPLWLHSTGQWAKKIRGRYYYFGVYQNAALNRADELEQIFQGAKWIPVHAIETDAGMTPPDTEKIRRDPMLLRTRINGRECYRADSLVETIRRLGIPWKRTAISQARATVELEELFPDDCRIGVKSLAENLSVASQIICDSLTVSQTFLSGLQIRRMSDHRTLNAKEIRGVLRKLKTDGDGWWADSQLIRAALRRRENPEPTPEPDTRGRVIAAEAARMRANREFEEERERLRLLSIYGDLLRRHASLTGDEQMTLAATVDVLEDLDAARIDRDIALIAEVQRLKAMAETVTPEDVVDAEKELADAIGGRQANQRTWSSLPESEKLKIHSREKFARDRVRELTSLPQRIEALKAERPELFATVEV